MRGKCQFPQLRACSGKNKTTVIIFNCYRKPHLFGRPTMTVILYVWRGVVELILCDPIHCKTLKVFETIKQFLFYVH